MALLPEHELRCEQRQPDHQYTKEIGDKKDRAAMFAQKRRKLPEIIETDCRATRGQDHRPWRGPVLISDGVRSAAPLRRIWRSTKPQLNCTNHLRWASNNIAERDENA
ncbi:MAG: hypothetical protein AMS22_17975 [Thiotrichales bacterium SG8_50]|nr:MAG: hypothetical protein AMS22_17975 [Thiotrichales bacterium SG8_50]